MADVFAVGCVIAEICTLRLPVQAIWLSCERLFEQVQLKNELLLAVARRLLHLDEHSRISAVSLRTHFLLIQRTTSALDDTMVKQRGTS